MGHTPFKNSLCDPECTLHSSQHLPWCSLVSWQDPKSGGGAPCRDIKAGGREWCHGLVLGWGASQSWSWIPGPVVLLMAQVPYLCTFGALPHLLHS